MSCADFFSGCNKILHSFFQEIVSCQLFGHLLLLRSAFRAGPRYAGHSFQTILTIVVATWGRALVEFRDFLNFWPQWMKLETRITRIAQIVEHLKSLKLTGKYAPYILMQYIIMQFWKWNTYSYGHDPRKIWAKISKLFSQRVEKQISYSQMDPDRMNGQLIGRSVL